MSTNIYTNLELPTNAVIHFNFVPRPLVSKAARKLEEAEMVKDVNRALQVWYYENYC